MNATLHQWRPATKGKNALQSGPLWRICHNIYQRNTWNASQASHVWLKGTAEAVREDRHKEKGGGSKHAITNYPQGKCLVHQVQAARDLKHCLRMHQYTAEVISKHKVSHIHKILRKHSTFFGGKELSVSWLAFNTNTIKGNHSVCQHGASCFPITFFNR